MESKRPNDQPVNAHDDKTVAESAAQKFAAEANARPPASKSLLEEGLAYTVSAITSNKNTQDTIAKYGSEFLTTAALVMPGRTGFAATTVLSAFDHAHVGESSSAQAADLALGAVSGVATRGAYRLLGSRDMNPATAGIAFSLVNRTTGALSDKSNYIEQNGQFSLTAGLGKAMYSVMDANAIKADAMIFGGSLYASKLAESISPIMKTATARRVTMGTVFGAANGANAEISAEKNNDKFDYLAIAKSAATHGAVDGLAFGVGGIREGKLSDAQAHADWVEASAQSEQGARISLGTRLERFRRIVETDFLRHPSQEPHREVLGSELPKELEGPVSDKHPTKLGYVSGNTMLEFRTEEQGPFASYLDFIQRGTIKVSTPIRTYQAGEGSVPIIVPEDYAKQLDLAHNSSPELTPERQQELQQRVGPADVAEALVYLPDRSYFKRVIVSDKRNPDDTWVTQDYKKGEEEFWSSMGVLRGEVELYSKKKDVFFIGDLKHEWSHELHFRHYDDPLAWGFGQSVDIEKSEWAAREYMNRQKEDQFAVMGERLIGTNEAEFLEAADKAPLRTIFYMKALEKALAEVAPENRSVAHEEYERRIQYVKENVIPKAVQKLDNILANGTSFQQQTARNIFYNMRMEDMMPKDPVAQPDVVLPTTEVTYSSIQPAALVAVPIQESAQPFAAAS